LMTFGKFGGALGALAGAVVALNKVAGSQPTRPLVYQIFGRIRDAEQSEAEDRRRLLADWVKTNGNTTI
jgi:hypothetical protein